MDDRAFAARRFERYALTVVPAALCVAALLYLKLTGPQPEWWWLGVGALLALSCGLQLRVQRRQERSIRVTAETQGAAAALRVEARWDGHASWLHMGRLKGICSELERLEGPAAAALLRNEIHEARAAARFRPKWYGVLALAAYFLLVVGLVVLSNR